MTPEQREFYERGYKAGRLSARKPWTKRDVKRLIEWDGDDAELALALNRSPLAVRLKRHKLKKAGEM